MRPSDRFTIEWLLKVCHKFSQSSSAEKLAKKFKMQSLASLRLQSRPQIKTRDAVLTITKEIHKRPEWMSFGLIPTWSKLPDKYYINARSESLHEKPTFKTPFKSCRCLIPADSFFETKNGASSREYEFTLKSKEPFAMAGLWSHWMSADGSEIISCAVITTPPNEIVRKYHDRMPAIIDEKDYETWLDRKNYKEKDLMMLLKPYDSEQLECRLHENEAEWLFDSV